MSLHLPHHIPHPHPDAELLGLLWALGLVALTMLTGLAVFWILTYSGAQP